MPKDIGRLTPSFEQKNLPWTALFYWQRLLPWSSLSCLPGCDPSQSWYRTNPSTCAWVLGIRRPSHQIWADFVQSWPLFWAKNVWFGPRFCYWQRLFPRSSSSCQRACDQSQSLSRTNTSTCDWMLGITRPAHQFWGDLVQIWPLFWAKNVWLGPCFYRQRLFPRSGKWSKIIRS